MIKHIWTLVCREAMIDEDTNNVSLLDTYENLQFSLNVEDPKYKPGNTIAIPFKFEVVSMFFRDSTGKSEVMEELLAVLGPKGQKLAEVSAKVEFKPENDRMRNIMRFETIPLTNSGTYLFQSFTTKTTQKDKKDLVAAVPVNISLSVNGETV